MTTSIEPKQMSMQAPLSTNWIDTYIFLKKKAQLAAQEGTKCATLFYNDRAQQKQIIIYYKQEVKWYLERAADVLKTNGQ